MTHVCKGYILNMFEDKGADGIYVHHAVRERTENSSSVTIGISHVLKKNFPGLGYFCPIQPSANAQSKLRRQVDHNVSDISQSKAYRCLVDDKVDNLLEEIYRAYELCRRRHDFLIIEGTDLKNAGNIITLNAKIASALAVPALLVTDARLSSRIMETGSDDLEGVLGTTKISHSIFRHNLVDVLGALVYNVVQMGRQKHYQNDFQFPGFRLLDVSRRMMSCSTLRHFMIDTSTLGSLKRWCLSCSRRDSRQGLAQQDLLTRFFHVQNRRNKLLFFQREKRQELCKPLVLSYKETSVM